MKTLALLAVGATASWWGEQDTSMDGRLLRGEAGAVGNLSVWLEDRMEAGEAFVAAGIVDPDPLVLVKLFPAFARHWGEPAVAVKGDGGSSFDGLEADTVEAALEQMQSGEEFSLVLRIEHLPPAEAAAAEAVIERAFGVVDFARGDTAHIYVSSAGTSALNNHTDTSDIYVVHLAGAKEWIYCAPPAITWDKLETCAAYGDDEMVDVLPECSTTTLRPGDGLFLPRRTIHSARAVGGAPSVHLTLGLRERAQPCQAYLDATEGAASAFEDHGSAFDLAVDLPPVAYDDVHLLVESGDGDALSVKIPGSLQGSLSWRRLAKRKARDSKAWAAVAARLEDTQLAESLLWLEFDVGVSEPGLFEIVPDVYDPTFMLDQYFGDDRPVSLDAATRASYVDLLGKVRRAGGRFVDHGFFHGRTEGDVLGTVRVEAELPTGEFAAAAAHVFGEERDIFEAWAACVPNTDERTILSLDVQPSGAAGFGLTLWVPDGNVTVVHTAVNCLATFDGSGFSARTIRDLDARVADVTATDDDEDSLATHMLSHVKLKFTSTGELKAAKTYVRVVGKPARSDEDYRRRLTVCNSGWTDCPSGKYSGSGHYSGSSCNGCNQQSCNYPGVCSWDRSCDDSCDSCNGCVNCKPNLDDTRSHTLLCRSSCEVRSQPRPDELFVRSAA